MTTITKNQFLLIDHIFTWTDANPVSGTYPSGFDSYPILGPDWDIDAPAWLINSPPLRFALEPFAPCSRGAIVGAAKRAGLVEMEVPQYEWETPSGEHLDSRHHHPNPQRVVYQNIRVTERGYRAWLAMGGVE